MKLMEFHHPDICPVVIRRHVTEELLDLMVAGLELTSKRGKRLWMSARSTEWGYYSAVARLRKKGLIAQRGRAGRAPVFVLTNEGESRTSAVCRGREPWPKKWNGIWYQLAYDVPEVDRPYREVLRGFLKRMRMGCLQKSVWITPHDIRPDYADLAKTARVDLYSFLFEARTVLGRSSGDVVRLAWDMERLKRAQRWYMNVYEENLARARAGKLTEESLYTMAREELSAYVTVMEGDPLLPRPLWPQGYQGEKAWHFHRHFTKEWAQLI